MCILPLHGLYILLPNRLCATPLAGHGTHIQKCKDTNIFYNHKNIFLFSLFKAVAFDRPVPEGAADKKATPEHGVRKLTMTGPVLQLFFGISSVFLRWMTEEIPKKYRRNTEEMRE